MARKPELPDNSVGLLQKRLVVVNIGLELFARSLEAQGGEVVQVAWAPPAQGDTELIGVLDELL